MLIVRLDANLICKLTSELSKSFDMKDFGLERQILGMEIIGDKKNKKLWLSEEKDVEWVLEHLI